MSLTIVFTLVKLLQRSKLLSLLFTLVIDAYRVKNVKLRKDLQIIINNRVNY